MPAFLRCSHCEEFRTVEERLIGKKVRCPACGEVGLVKAEDGATAAYPVRTESRTKVLPKKEKEAGEASVARRGIPLVAVFCLVCITGASACLTGAGITVITMRRLAHMTPAASTQEASARVDRVDLAQLLAEWEKNPVAVIEEHKGAEIETTGFVNEVGSNISNQTYLLISARPKREGKDPYLQAFFLDPGLTAQLKDYPIGAQMTFRVLLVDVNKTARGRVVKII